MPVYFLVIFSRALGTFCVGCELVAYVPDTTSIAVSPSNEFTPCLSYVSLRQDYY